MSKQMGRWLSLAKGGAGRNCLSMEGVLNARG